MRTEIDPVSERSCVLVSGMPDTLPVILGEIAAYFEVLALNSLRCADESHENLGQHIQHRDRDWIFSPLE
jgi:hypothetical protein